MDCDHDWGGFDRSICGACEGMHQYCVKCGLNDCPGTGAHIIPTWLNQHFFRIEQDIMRHADQLEERLLSMAETPAQHTVTYPVMSNRKA